MIALTGSEDDVARVFDPRSVAVIGASSRPGTLSWWPLHLMLKYGFAGDIYPINPSRAEIDGVRCYPSLLDVDAHIDVAVVALDAERSMDAVRECAKADVGAVVLPSQGFGETSEAGRRAQEAMLDTARAAGMRLVGPNTDGVANLATGALMSIQPLFGQGIGVGPVAVITQSGASAGSLIARLNREGIGCRLYASAGNEVDFGLADYLSVAVQDPEVRIVLSFVEAIRRPGDFAEVARLAQRLGKPIVLIKVGRTEQAAERAAAHTGALAGRDDIYTALFRSLGIIRVSELGEIVAVTKYFLACGVPRSNRVGIMSVSGGQAGAMADRAGEGGLEIPRLDDATSQRLEDLLRFGTGLNPCDLTGDIAKDPTIAAQVYDAFDADPAIDCVVYARKELTGTAGRESARILADRVATDRAPLAVYAMDGGVNDDEADTYRRRAVPVYANAAELFTAIGALARYGRQRDRRPAPGADPVRLRPEVVLPGHRGPLGEKATKQLLAAYDIRVPEELVVTSADAAVTAADSIGYPVVLKLVSDRILHKTEIGGVLLGVRDAAGVRAGVATLLDRARRVLDGAESAAILVQEQLSDGVEMIAGLVVDEHFGPFVLLGSGGVLAELLADSVLLPAPAAADDVRAALAGLRATTLLDGYRGAPPADTDALVETIVALSWLGHHHADRIAELDLNPIRVRPAGLGAVALDALVVLS